MSSARLIIANHADDIEVLPRIDLVVCLRLCRLVYDALSNIGKQLSRYGVSDRTIAWRFLETNGIIKPRQVARAGSHLELLKVERLDLANEAILVLQAVCGCCSVDSSRCLRVC